MVMNPYAPEKSSTPPNLQQKRKEVLTKVIKKLEERDYVLEEREEVLKRKISRLMKQIIELKKYKET